MSVIGILYPGRSAEDDYPRLEAHLRSQGYAVRLPLVHTSVGEDAHRVDALLDLGGADRLAEGTDQLLTDHGPLEALVWACTSGSFVFGWEGAHDQVRRLADRAGVPASSTSLAFIRACRRLGLTRVAVAASYPVDVAGAFVAFLDRAGIDVTALGSHDIVTAAEVGTLDRDQVLHLAGSVDRAGAQAVLVPDTAMHTAAWLDDLEAALGTTVLTANQVTVHDALALLGDVPAVPGLGRLFASPHPATAPDERLATASGSRR